MYIYIYIEITSSNTVILQNFNQWKVFISDRHSISKPVPVPSSLYPCSNRISNNHLPPPSLWKCMEFHVLTFVTKKKKIYILSKSLSLPRSAFSTKSNFPKKKKKGWTFFSRKRNARAHYFHYIGSYRTVRSTIRMDDGVTNSTNSLWNCYRVPIWPPSPGLNAYNVYRLPRSLWSQLS